MKTILILCLFVVLGLAKDDVLRYDGNKVLIVLVENQHQLQSLNKLVQRLYLDVWSADSVLVVGNNHIRINSADQEELIRAISPNVFTFIPDVQHLIDIQNNQTKNVKADWFDSYHPYAEIVSYLKELAGIYANMSKFTPSIGKSIEGRDIPAITIAAGTTEKKIWFEGGQHAREWIGPATVMYIIRQLLTQYGKDPKVTKFMNEVEFTIVPLVNPDGYEHTWNKERLWRKNRRNNGDGSFGVDLNRNWDDHWGGAGSSSDPRSDIYHGTGPFSEPESTAVSNLLNTLFPNVLAAIDFHSYSQLVLRPYGWTTAISPDNAALKVLGDGVRDSIYSVHQKTYVSQRSIDLYITTGSAGDWFYQEGIWGAYTIELRDTGKYGFVLPPAEIIPTGQEIWISMIYFVDHVLKNHPGL